MSLKRPQKYRQNVAAVFIRDGSFLIVKKLGKKSLGSFRKAVLRRAKV